jgi:hypothetical protein
MNTEFSIKKSSIEVYYIRPKGHHCGWADISIDEGEKSGRVSISSDYGNWAYYWGACGSGFKQFLIALDIHYAAGKFGSGSYFDHEATMKKIRTDILNARREDFLTKDKAREMWDSLTDLEDCNSKETFVTLCWYSPIMELYDTGPNIISTIEPGFRRFWETTWKSFISELKNEILVLA